jgi:DNA-binding transcriptional LysR family regulator
MSLGPMRTPQLDELRGFCAAVECGSISRAADQLHLTQPALSRRLRGLEQALAASLLDRSAHGVQMTTAGERLYAHARRVISEVDELNATLGEMAALEAVRLAISHTAAEGLMPRALVLMHHEFNAPVEVLIANSRLVKEMVRTGKVDVGVAAFMSSEDPSDLVVEPLIDDELVVAVPMGHPWARGWAIKPEELLHTPVVLRDPGAHSRQVVDETLKAHGLGKLHAVREVGSTQAAKEEARELGLPTVLSKFSVSMQDMLETVPVKGMRMQRQFCLLRRHGAPSNAARCLIEAFHASVAERSDTTAEVAERSDTAAAAADAAPDLQVQVHETWTQVPNGAPGLPRC